MASDGHLCDLCSEIFDEPGQLQDHLLADHDIKREAELDIDTTECIQSDPNEEVEFYDPLPVMEDDDIEDEFILDVTSLEGRRAASSLLKASKPVSNPIQVHYNQIIEGQSQKRGMVRKQRTEWYQCDQCGFKTKTKGVLKTHKLTHTFDCVLCPFKTVIPDALIIHIKRVHCGEPQKPVHVIHQRQQHQHLQYSLEPQQHTQQLEHQAELGGDVQEVKSVNQFLLLDSMNQTDVSQREDNSRFSYLNTPRKSVIINFQDSELIQNAYTFLQSTLDSDTSQLL